MEDRAAVESGWRTVGVYDEGTHDSMNESERGHTIEVGGLHLNYHDIGNGEPVLLLHGSGPGVSAWANWGRLMPALAENGFRSIAPDIPGFGYSDPVAGFDLDSWLSTLTGLLDHLGIEKAHLIGNSLGGALALHLAVRCSERWGRGVTMGTAGGSFRLTAGLDQVWGYEPSPTSMRSLLEVFAYDSTLITDDLVRLRHAASMRPGAHRAYHRLFPPPRQRWVDALVVPADQLENVQVPFLLVHGRDDRVVPLESSLDVLRRLANGEMHIFGQCGHWVQNERSQEFAELVVSYFRRPARC